MRYVVFASVFGCFILSLFKIVINLSNKRSELLRMEPTGLVKLTNRYVRASSVRFMVAATVLPNGVDK